jgi:hypothetical protein
MKTRIKLLLTSVLFTVFFLGSLVSFADDPLPTVPGTHGTSGDAPVGAPIDNGVIFLLALGIGYAVYKLYKFKKARAKHV